MMVTFEGVVTNSFVFTDPFGFGTGSGALNGRTVTGSFQYDPDLAPPDSDVDVNQVFHKTSSNSAAWFSTPQVFIDGVAVPVPSFDLFAGYTTDVAYIGLKDQVSPGFDTVEYSRTLYQFWDSSNIHSFDLDLSVNSIASGTNIIDSLLLSTPYTVSDFSTLDTTGTSISARRTDGGATAYDFTADFALTPNTLKVAMVPEPSTALLVGFGLAALGAVRGRRPFHSSSVA
jgi:hypothetical protein